MADTWNGAWSGSWSGSWGFAPGSEADVRASWFKFNPVAAALFLSWAQFNPLAADVRMSWAAFQAYKDVATGGGGGKPRKRFRTLTERRVPLSMSAVGRGVPSVDVRLERVPVFSDDEMLAFAAWMWARGYA